ncbi:hypothetical protein [Nocardia mexicana]|uniref:Uncharacterized protein n=1 Tax=Nocardia mexicana TaxID=279262 RepID=A0A370HB43_9NOCA|nr:hypothetical protein [Nocardia mexicana]RDI54163.1 hypothetical protein DFR68_102287 [Nocardia mexicana]
MIPRDSARTVRDRLGWLFEFRVAMVALCGVVLCGAAAVTAVQSRAWGYTALFVLVAVPCVLVVAVNIVVETASYAYTWLIVAVGLVILPLLLIPDVRCRFGRMWLRRRHSGESAAARRS